MHPRLSEITRYVDTQRSAVLAAAEPLPPARWTERPAADRWSVSEVMEHLHRVERGTARLIGLRAAEARAAGHPVEEEESSLLHCLDGARLTDRSRPITAPERVAPAGGWSRTAALEALASSRAELHAAIGAADGLALQSLRHEHPRLGDIDMYQWILFIGQHEARHAEQLHEIVRSLGALAS